MTGWKESIVWEFYDAKQNMHGSQYVGELIRCKYCVAWDEEEQHGCTHDMGANDYCSKAERKEE